MSKTVLLELTEKEAEILEQAVLNEKALWGSKSYKDVSGTLIENTISTCNLLKHKIDEALKPKEEVLITHKDFYLIKSVAVDQYRHLSGDTRISNKDMEYRDLANISLANAVITWLNGKGLLKTLARFDFTDHSCEFEESE